MGLFGWGWVVGDVGGYVVGGGGWWWMLVGIFWKVVGSGGYF